jgi:uncharacterized protein
MHEKVPLLNRPRLLSRLATALDEAPVVALLGARQTGKTTLAQLLARAFPSSEPVHRFDLETSADLAALRIPEMVLAPLEGMVIIDEVQRQPDLFRVLRPLVDRDPLPARFLLLGSASPDLVRGVSETLAGRVRFVQVGGFSLDEVAPERFESLWLRGGFPRSFLAESDAASSRWRESFISTFLERDIPQLGIRVPAETLRRFWIMLCHFHGNIWNASELARSLGSSEKTARHYLDILAGSFMVRVLPPWHENIAKRQFKSPKVYLRDTGLLHQLLGIESMSDLRSHGKFGASWEGFALEQTLELLGESQAFFWGTHSGAELDLMVTRHGRRYGFEFKCTDSPSMSRSLHTALDDLHLARAYVVYPGARRFPIHECAEALPLAAIGDLDAALR